MSNVCIGCSSIDAEKSITVSEKIVLSYRETSTGYIETYKEDDYTYPICAKCKRIYSIQGFLLGLPIGLLMSIAVVLPALGYSGIQELNIFLKLLIVIVIGAALFAFGIGFGQFLMYKAKCYNLIRKGKWKIKIRVLPVVGYTVFLSLIFILDLFLLKHTLHFSNEQHIWEVTRFFNIKGPYLDRKPPGLEPELFAPLFVSRQFIEGTVVFFDNGKKLVFNNKSEEVSLCFSQLQNGRWTPPKRLNTGGYVDGDVTASPDDRCLYFTNKQDPFIYFSILMDNGWTFPKILIPMVDSGPLKGYPCITSDGVIYFFSKKPEGFGENDLYRAIVKDGHCLEEKNVGPVFNTEFNEKDPYVAPDESYLIFSSTRPSGLGKDDLYISFRRPDGTWTKPKNMGKGINSSAREYHPFVTSDGQYLFFTSTKAVDESKLVHINKKYRPKSGDRNGYWVNALILNQFRSE